MNVKELIQELQQIENKDLSVRLCIKTLEDQDDYENYWLRKINVFENISGYELHGEVILYDE